MNEKEKTIFNMLLHFANEALEHSKAAVRCYQETNNGLISAQFINQAYQSTKHAQTSYMMQYNGVRVFEYEQLCDMMTLFSRDFFRETAEQSEDGLTLSLIDLQHLEDAYEEFRKWCIQA